MRLSCPSPPRTRSQLDLRLDTWIRKDHSPLGRLQRIFMYRFWQQRFFALVASLVTALLLWKVFKASYWESLGLGTLVFVGSLRFVGGIAPDPTNMNSGDRV